MKVSRLKRAKKTEEEMKSTERKKVKKKVTMTNQELKDSLLCKFSSAKMVTTWTSTTSVTKNLSQKIKSKNFLLTKLLTKDQEEKVNVVATEEVETEDKVAVTEVEEEETETEMTKEEIMTTEEITATEEDVVEDVVTTTMVEEEEDMMTVTEEITVTEEDKEEDLHLLTASLLMKITIERNVKTIAVKVETVKVVDVEVVVDVVTMMTVITRMTDVNKEKDLILHLQVMIRSSNLLRKDKFQVYQRKITDFKFD